MPSPRIHTNNTKKGQKVPNYMVIVYQCKNGLSIAVITGKSRHSNMQKSKFLQFSLPVYILCKFYLLGVLNNFVLLHLVRCTVFKRQITQLRKFLLITQSHYYILFIAYHFKYNLYSHANGCQLLTFCGAFMDFTIFRL